MALHDLNSDWNIPAEFRLEYPAGISQRSDLSSNLLLRALLESIYERCEERLLVPSPIEADHGGPSLDLHVGTPTCRECGSPLVADASGYLVCSNCGLVDEESILVTSVEEPHYHKPSLRQRKALEREEAELEAKAREGARRTSFREIQRLVEKYEERYGWRNAEAFVEKLSHRYPFLASAFRRALDELRIEGRVRTRGSERAKRFKQVLIDRCCRALCEGGVHPSFAVKAVREVLEELGEEGLPSYFALRPEDRVRLAEEKRRERLRAIKRVRKWSERVAGLLEKIAELPGFQELDVNVLEQALRALLGLRYREASKKKFDLALKKINMLVRRVSVRRFVDELGFSLEEVALLKKRPLEKVRRSYWIERCLKRRADEVVAKLRESFESEEAVEACLRVMRRDDPEIKVVIGHPIPQTTSATANR